MNGLRPLRIVAVLSTLLLAAPRLPAADAGELLVHAVTAVNVTVSDADELAQFFCNVLDFERIGEHVVSGPEFESLTGLVGAKARMVKLRLGDESLLLTDYQTPAGRAMPADSRADDRWFQHIAIVVSDIEAAAERLRQHHVQLVSDEPQTLPAWNANAAGIAALYFRDPDGHFLEVIQFPREKGDARWHEPTQQLFLGIDHTAIVVADTAASLKFYRDDLGFSVAGTSENYGPQQERLNGVRGAHLRITTLRPPQGPGVELLEYVAPTDGRVRPLDSRPNDLWHWQIDLSVDAARGCSDSCSGQAILANDPDRHVVKLVTEGAEE